jgi:hypothetical protein
MEALILCCPLGPGTPGPGTTGAMVDVAEGEIDWIYVYNI